jgi:hypothetical protein
VRQRDAIVPVALRVSPVCGHQREVGAVEEGACGRRLRRAGECEPRRVLRELVQPRRARPDFRARDADPRAARVRLLRPPGHVRRNGSPPGRVAEPALELAFVRPEVDELLPETDHEDGTLLRRGVTRSRVEASQRIASSCLRDGLRADRARELVDRPCISRGVVAGCSQALTEESPFRRPARRFRLRPGAHVELGERVEVRPLRVDRVDGCAAARLRLVPDPGEDDVVVGARRLVRGQRCGERLPAVLSVDEDLRLVRARRGRRRAG